MTESERGGTEKQEQHQAATARSNNDAKQQRREATTTRSNNDAKLGDAKLGDAKHQAAAQSSNAAIESRQQ